jgi:hypothetical protein
MTGGWEEQAGKKRKKKTSPGGGDNLRAGYTCIRVGFTAQQKCQASIKCDKADGRQIRMCEGSRFRDTLRLQHLHHGVGLVALELVVSRGGRDPGL